ncbi:hypothetical protein CO230_08760 [Chryseobacterium sp. 6424]|uniref:hypothetical protein n=1 Tax=Chryseobacterium sp. 6424 TaxID=2039166 RepID=UPI000EFAFB06|nr:hypothetical protein [Chryseobacterium sp. 6424]AYO58205.1 hypothetical protein CO230_08760 [Chryseobacterium sp. 6424]
MTSEKTKRRQKRDEQVRQYFAELEAKYPQWRLDALLDKTAERFPPISAATVSAILNKSGIYK